MGKIIEINMAEIAVGHNNTVIKTGSIGSCVVITLYDREAKAGGMAHAMLPSKKILNKGDVVEEARRNIITPEAKAKYADEAIDILIEDIEKMGGKKERLKAKLVGGARMFRILSKNKEGIGYKNVKAAKDYLEELDIPIENEETGGTVGRLAEFNLNNGLVEVVTKM